MSDEFQPFTTVVTDLNICLSQETVISLKTRTTRNLILHPQCPVLSGEVTPTQNQICLKETLGDFGFQGVVPMSARFAIFLKNVSNVSKSMSILHILL